MGNHLLLYSVLRIAKKIVQTALAAPAQSSLPSLACWRLTRLGLPATARAAVACSDRPGRNLQGWCFPGPILSH